MNGPLIHTQKFFSKIFAHKIAEVLLQSSNVVDASYFLELPQSCVRSN